MAGADYEDHRGGRCLLRSTDQDRSQIAVGSPPAILLDSVGVRLVTILQTGKAHIDGGRDGRATTADGFVDVPLHEPERAGAASGTTPEALFGAAYGACFASALARIRRDRHLPTVAIGADCTVHLTKRADGYGLSVEMAIVLPETATDDALDQMRAAHLLCPYSRAIVNTVPVSLVVNGHEVKQIQPSGGRKQ